MLHFIMVSRSDPRGDITRFSVGRFTTIEVVSALTLIPLVQPEKLLHCATRWRDAGNLADGLRNKAGGGEEGVGGWSR